MSINFLLVVCELSQRLQSDCVGNIRNIHGNRGLGLPSPGRFGGGLSSSPINLISVPQAMPVSGKLAIIVSVDQTWTYPLARRMRFMVGGTRFCHLPRSKDDEKQVNSGHDKPHSYFISSREKIQLKQGHGNPVELPGHTEEFLDSATSTEISFTQSRSNTCTLDGCSPSVTLRANVERTAKQVSY